MKEQDERLLKEMYASQNESQDARLAQGLCGSIGSNQCARPNLRDRIEGQAQSAEYQGMKAARLRELSVLLEKNPEVCRILELMSEVRD